MTSIKRSRSNKGCRGSIEVEMWHLGKKRRATGHAGDCTEAQASIMKSWMFSFDGCWTTKFKCGGLPVMALRISVAAASLISSEACSLYQAVCGVQIRFGASFSGPWAKLQHTVKLIQYAHFLQQAHDGRIILKQTSITGCTGCCGGLH